jgi:hypothetical protein
MSRTISTNGAAKIAMPAPDVPPMVRASRRVPRIERLRPVTREAQRRATAVLEVLAGGRTPNEAAAAVGISPPRYYLLEQRALAGLVAACEPPPAGKRPNAQRRIAELEREVSRLRQECSRQQALVRAAQRTIGLAPPAPKPPAKLGGKAAGKPGGKKGRSRRPAVRALKAAATIRAATVDEPNSSGATSAEVLQPRATEGPSPAATPLHVAPAPAEG